MVALVLVGVFFAGAFIFTSMSRQSDRRRRNGNRHHRRGGHSRRRNRHDYDDDYDDDDYDDDDDYSRRHRRGGRNRRDDYYDDYTGMFIGLGILILIGLGIYYRYGQSNHSNELTKSKIVMTSDYTTPNDEQQTTFEDDYPANNNVQNEDLDEDVGPIEEEEEEIPEVYDELDAETEIPQEVVPGNFYAQVHAFGDLDNASAAKDDWIAKGESVKVVYFKKGDGLYHVLIGGYPSARAAKSFMGKAYEQIYELVEGQYYDLN